MPLGLYPISGKPIADATLVAPTPAPNLTPPVYPERVVRPQLHASQQHVFGAPVLPIPNPTFFDSGELHPDFVKRPTLHPSQHLAVTGLSPAPIANPGHTFYLLDSLAGGFMAMQDGGTPPATATMTDTGWTVDTVVPTKYALQGSQLVIASTSFSATVAPDGVTSPDAGFGDAWRSLAPLNETISAASTWTLKVGFIASGSTVAGGQLTFYVWKAGATGTAATKLTSGILNLPAVSNLTTSTQQNVQVTIPMGSVTFANEYLFVQVAWEITSASAATGATVLYRQDATNSLLSILPPATTLNITPPVFADVVRGASFVAALQSARDASPVAPAAAALAPNLTPPVFPDTASRPFLPAALQLPMAAPSPSLERTAPLFPVTHPDRVERPAFTAAAQLAATDLPPAPERVAPLAATAHPDRIDRPSFAAAQQLAITEIPPLPLALVALPTFFEGIFADAVRAPRPAAFLTIATVLPATERTAALSATTFPDRIDGRSLPTSQHLASTELPPKPERSSPLAAVVHPDRIDRALFAASAQLAASAISPLPIVGPPAPTFFGVVFPDAARAARQIAHVAPALAAASPLPIPGVVVPTFFGGLAPEFLARARPVAHGAQASVLPVLERPAPLAAPVFPDATARPAINASAQLAATEIPPKPERPLPFSPPPVHPDHVDRPALPSSEQLAAGAFAPTPERTRPIAAAVHPDRVHRPIFGAALQQSITELAPAPEQKSTFFEALFPDAILRPRLIVAAQLAAPPVPRVTTPAFVEGYFQDRVDRAPMFATLSPIWPGVALPPPAPIPYFLPLFGMRLALPSGGMLRVTEDAHLGLALPSGGALRVAPTAGLALTTEEAGFTLRVEGRNREE